MRSKESIILLLASVAGLATAAPGGGKPCVAKVMSMCPATSQEACLDCVGQNEAEIFASGCTEGSVGSICTFSTCFTGLDTFCPTVSSKEECGRCFQANEDDLTSFGCTPEISNRICSKLTNTSDPSPPIKDRPVPITQLPTGATASNPLRVFLQAGQSGCVGQSSVEELNQDPNPFYDEVKGMQEGVWFAGLHAGAKYQAEYVGGDDGLRFFMGPLITGQESRNGGFFGPDASIGRRLADADDSNAPVLIIKYCWGGSNVLSQWNPTSIDNYWDRNEDNGSAQWLLENVADLHSKDHLYANFIYTIRRSLELLEGVVPYKLSGLFWLQGSADKERPWKEYGYDLVNLFEMIRSDLDEPTLPVVDTGGSGNKNPQTAKAYASSVVDGCNVVVAEFGLSVQDPDSSCQGGSGNTCIGVSYQNWDIMDYYGYDPLIGEDIKPDGASDKIFYWFKKFPTNNHLEYEGDILKGRMMANAYIRHFTDDELRPEWIEDDIQILFPVDSCDPSINGGKPSDTNICWTDQRTEADLAEATCP